MNERRGRLHAADVEGHLEDIRQLRLVIDWDHDEAVLLDLTRQFSLSAYDAAYLEVARRRGLPLCTLDVRLRHAAEEAGVTAWTPG